MSYKQRKLSRRRFLKLDAAGFVWDPFEAAWEEGFDRFVAWPADANGRRVVPKSHTTPDGYALGRWQERQRTARVHREVGSLSEWPRC